MKLIKVVKTAVNYSINPLASMRNPITPILRLKNTLAEAQKKDGVPYLKFKSDIILSAEEIDRKCQRLRFLSFICFVCMIVLIASAFLVAIIGRLAFMPLFEAFTVLCFSSSLFAFSLKFAFLAHGVENNHFKYANPLEYMKKNTRIYFAWLMANKYQTQNSFK